MKILPLLSLSATLWAQSAQVSGLVLDSSGAILPGAMVTLTNEDTGIRRTVGSNNEGWYTIPVTQPGVYKIRAGRDGFQPVVRFGLGLRAGERLRVDFTLRIGGVEDSITVTSEPTQPGGEDTSLGMIVGRDMIDHLPLTGRGLAALVELVPGVIITPAGATESGQFSVNGARAGSNYITVDGVSANAGIQLIGVPGTPVVRQTLGGSIPIYTAIGTMQSLAAPETIQEFRLESAGTGAESGRTSGAQLSLVTRAGTNRFHGGASLFLRNEALDANDWFANQSGLARGRLRMRNFGVSAGGPISRDRMFFFVSLEEFDISHALMETRYLPTLESRLAAPTAVWWLTRALPLPNGTQVSESLGIYSSNAPRSSSADAFTLRIDRSLTRSAQLFVRLSHAPSSDGRQYAGALAGVNLALAATGFTAGLDHTLGPTTYHSIRFNYTSVDENYRVAPLGGLDFKRVSPLLELPESTGYGLSVTSVGLGLGYDRASAAQRQWNLVDWASLNRGSHTVQFGADVRGLAPGLGSAQYFVQNTYADFEKLAMGRILMTTVHRRNPVRLELLNVSAFGQDLWRPSPRVLFSFGIRWEMNPPPASVGDVPRFAAVRLGEIPSFALAPQGSALWRTGIGAFAPRGSVAYRLVRDGRLVFRASSGVYYDPGFGPALEAAASESRLTLVGGQAGLPPASPLTFLAGGSPDLATLSKVEAGFTAPRSFQWNAGLQARITDAISGSLSYVGTSGRRLLRNEMTLFPAFGLANVYTNGGRSSYNALQLQTRFALLRRMEGVVSFTWGHSIDNGSRDGDPFSQTAFWPGVIDRGSSSFDIRRSFSVALTADLPGSRRFGPLFRRWSLGGILRARTGFPITVHGITGIFPQGEQSRPDLIGSQPLWISDAGVAGGRRLNPVAFQMPTEPRQGTFGRNSIPGLGMAQLDIALERSIHLWEQIELRLRLESFNVTNHPNFGNPEAFLGSPSFGRSTSLLDRFLGEGGPGSGLVPALQIGGPRSVHVAVRLQF